MSSMLLQFAVATTIFVVKDRRNKKRGELLKKQSQQENQPFIGTDYSLKTDDTKQHKEEKQDEKMPEEATFEDFSMAPLANETPKPDEVPEKQNEYNQNDFMFDDDFDDDFDDNMPDDIDFDKFQEFLRERLKLDDEEAENSKDDAEGMDAASESENADVASENEDEAADEMLKKALNISSKHDLRASANSPQDSHGLESRIEDSVLEALQQFDEHSFDGKTDEEIENMLKNLPPHAQEILWTDIRARRRRVNQK